MTYELSEKSCAEGGSALDRGGKGDCRSLSRIHEALTENVTGHPNCTCHDRHGPTRHAVEGYEMPVLHRSTIPSRLMMEPSVFKNSIGSCSPPSYLILGPLATGQLK